MPSELQPTTQQIVERSLNIRPHRTAVIDGDRQVTYGQLRSRSAKLANALRAFGANLDRPAASWIGNCLEFLEFDVACARGGVTRLGIGDRLSGEECSYILGHSGARVLITTREFVDKLEGCDIHDVEHILIVGRDAGLPADFQGARVTSYETTLGRAGDTLSADVAVGADAPNFLMYTSGTTGRPKAAAHSHGGRAAAMVNMLASELRALGPDSVFAHLAPVTHGSGSKILSVLAVGGVNLICRRADPDTVKDAVDEHGATHAFVVPTILQRWLDAGEPVRAAVASMREISFGGSPISAPVYTSSLEKFGPILTQVYGTSEMPHPITVLSAHELTEPDPRLLGSAGRAAAGVAIKVTNRDGDEVGAGEVGELLVRAPHAMVGYWKDPAATEAVFGPGRWYRSGDLVRLDEDGLVTFHDRERDLIISGGLNVYPSEVERALCEHESVKGCAVVGAPDPEWGEAVIAYIVLRPGRELTEEAAIEWSRERLAGYKKPRRVRFVEELPTNSTGKVLKRELREAQWEGHSRRVA